MADSQEFGCVERRAEHLSALGDSQADAGQQAVAFDFGGGYGLWTITKHLQREAQAMTRPKDPSIN
jgi:hypothetical protein